MSLHNVVHRWDYPNALLIRGLESTRQAPAASGSVPIVAGPPTGLLYVNDTDVATLGVWVGRPMRGAPDGLDVRQPTGPVLGSLGRIQLTDAPQANPRTISVVGRQIASSTAGLLAVEDELKRLMYDGIVRVRMGDRADREWEAIARLGITPLGPWQTRTTQDIQFVFECADPVARAVADTVVDFSSGAAQRALGTGVSLPVIRLGGGATDPVVTVRDSSGSIVQTMGFTITLGASEWIEIDCEQQTIVDDEGANQAAAFDGLTEFIELNPYHGAGTSGPWPTLEASSGTLATARYRKRWL